MKALSISLAVFTCFLYCASITFACEGARPLAMGGAFTGLADDANATYWNPAAMGIMDEAEITYTGTAYDRDSLNYDDWLSLTIPLKPNKVTKVANLGTLGLAFMNNVDKGKYSFLYYDININVDAKITERWYMVSYGRELFELLKGLCIGANLRYLTHEEVLRASATIGGTTYTASASSNDDLVAIDLAMYYKWRDLSAGFLLQNANEPELTIFGTKGKYGANFRPGIAYRFKNRFILTGEIYDAFDNVNYKNARIGAEAKITDYAALRLGAYDFTATEKTGRAITAGIGLFPSETVGDIKIEISYATMYWYKSEAETKDKFSHLVSLSAKF